MFLFRLPFSDGMITQVHEGAKNFLKYFVTNFDYLMPTRKENYATIFYNLNCWLWALWLTELCSNGWLQLWDYSWLMFWYCYKYKNISSFSACAICLEVLLYCRCTIFCGLLEVCNTCASYLFEYPCIATREPSAYYNRKENATAHHEFVVKIYRGGKIPALQAWN